MADQIAVEYLNGPKARRWWPKAILVCAVLGGMYGAVIGSVVNTSVGAANVIGTLAGIVALLFAFQGTRFSSFFVLSLQNNMLSEKAISDRLRFGRLFLGTIAAISGAIFGGYLGLMAVTPLGLVLLGAIVGWIFMRAILRRFVVRRFLGGFAGIVLGAAVGAMIAALQKDQAAALLGIAFGFGIGAVIGPLLLLLFLGTLRSPPQIHGNDRGNVVDTTFHK